jgi:hypothetical protein
MVSFKRRGFALLFVIIAIGAMSLLMATTTAYNLTQSAYLRKVFQEKQAKRAATFALKIALARLQEAAGTDCAISAKKSSIYGNISAEMDSVGVWHTVKDGTRYATKFVRWLTPDYNSDYRQHSQKALEMRSCSTESKFRWDFSIHDESQKIDLSLLDETKDGYIRCLCPQCSGCEKVTTILVQKNRDPRECKNVDFLEQISLFDENLGKEILENADTYTLHSYGVLSKLDGLKTDLSTWLPATNFQSNDYIFEGVASMPVPPPTWKFLQSFFRLKDQVDGSGIRVSPTYPLYRPQYLVDYSQRSLHSLGDDLGVPTNHGIYPIVTQFNFSLSVAVIGGKLAIKICPKFALWNPHSVPLQQSNYQLDMLIAPRNPDEKICLTIMGKPHNPNTTNKIYTLNLCSNEIECHLKRMFGAKFSSAFAPGEVKMFSLLTGDDFEETRVASAVPGNYNNCFIVKTGLEAADYAEFTIHCTAQSGSLNLNWQDFYIRLMHQPSQAILQEIAQLSPDSNQSLSFIFRPNSVEKLLLTLAMAMKIGSLDDAHAATGIRWLSFANPRAPYVSRALFQDPASILFGSSNIPGNWSWNAKFTDDEAALDQRQLNYLDGLILFDTPSRDFAIPNVAFLRHVNWTPFGYLPCTCLGNSDPNPYIPMHCAIFQNHSSGIWPSHNAVEALLDYSYLLNEILFNNFFCSTASTWGNRLANRRFKILDQGVSPENMLVKGSFNVHSMSEETWEAYLSSRKNSLGEVIFPKIYNSNADKCTPFPKHEVRNLAKNIVTLVKQRSPFPTLGAFINRELSSEGTSRGLLQQAILNSNINRKTCRHHVAFGKNRSWFSDQAASGYLEEGLPEVLSQADVLQGLAHFISPRGDTFKIISHGSYDGCEKYCEAIVQRMPSFVDQGKNAATDTILTEANKKLGRRFNIVLFRWL